MNLHPCWSFNYYQVFGVEKYEACLSTLRNAQTSKAPLLKMKISFQTLIVSGVHNVDCVVPIYPLFLCFMKLAVDLQLLSWTQMRELKIKITFPEINNRNFVVSAGQLQFLTEMSRARNQRILRNYWKSYRLVKLVISHTEIQVNEAIKNRKAGKKKDWGIRPHPTSSKF